MQTANNIPLKSSFILIHFKKCSPITYRSEAASTIQNVIIKMQLPVLLRDFIYINLPINTPISSVTSTIIIKPKQPSMLVRSCWVIWLVLVRFLLMRSIGFAPDERKTMYAFHSDKMDNRVP